ncbi:protein argonaute MEL1-like [Pyrus communis]|uniref:protein argonaute MEL1-like n=1 Tax=Pyrus communis TaxID=23211 RepID=UPI0035C0A9C6
MRCNHHVRYDENNPRCIADANEQPMLHVCKVHSLSFHWYALEWDSCICSEIVFFQIPPAYYAHLAAFHARYYIKGEYSDRGSITGSTAAGAGGTGVRFRALPPS